MKTGFSFTKNRKVFFILTAVILVLGAVCMIVRGFNLDVDFTGGTTVTVSGLDAEISAELEKQITDAVGAYEGVTVSSFQKASALSADSGKTTYGFVMKIQGLTSDAEKRAKVEETIRTVLGNPGAEKEEDKLLPIDNISTSSVSGTVSGELRTAAILSSVIAILLMLVYITIRFDLSSGLAAVTCLAHDLFIMMIAYSLLQIPMGSTMIAALLTILGYSINATIIVFDRVRENRKKDAGADFDTSVNLSIRQTMRRSIFTSLTTLVTITALYVACKLGNITSVTNFALPLIVGIVGGFYSSTCLAGNLWCVYSKIPGIGAKKKK